LRLLKVSFQNLIPPRWPTRVFAVELMRRIIAMCRQSGTSPTHFDLAAARIFVRSGNKGKELSFFYWYYVESNFEIFCQKFKVLSELDYWKIRYCL